VAVATINQRRSFFPDKRFCPAALASNQKTILVNGPLIARSVRRLQKMASCCLMAD